MNPSTDSCGSPVIMPNRKSYNGRDYTSGSINIKGKENCACGCIDARTEWLEASKLPILDAGQQRHRRCVATQYRIPSAAN